MCVDYAVPQNEIYTNIAITIAIVGMLTAYIHMTHQSYILQIYVRTSNRFGKWNKMESSSMFMLYVYPEQCTVNVGTQRCLCNTNICL